MHFVLIYCIPGCHESGLPIEFSSYDYALDTNEEEEDKMVKMRRAMEVMKRRMRRMDVLWRIVLASVLTRYIYVGGRGCT